MYICIYIYIYIYMNICVRGCLEPYEGGLHGGPSETNVLGGSPILSQSQQLKLLVGG